MILNNKYNNVFGSVPIIGMIGLGGRNSFLRALKNIEILENEGIDGILLGNCHGSIDDLLLVIEEIPKKRNYKIGINILPNEFDLSLPLARKYQADFVQIDQIAGNYENSLLNLGHYKNNQLDFEHYEQLKKIYSEIIVLGGVWPKYYVPVEGSNLERDLKIGMQRAEAIVVTGEKTGKETPIDKIRKFREIIGKHPLIIGAGLTEKNAYEQLCISNGAIVGTSFRIPSNDNYSSIIDPLKVRDIMSIAKEVRKYKKEMNLSSY